MREKGSTVQPCNRDQTMNRELVTFAIRLMAFVVTLAPLGALGLPWVTLDGTKETLSGVATIALLAPPMGIYLYEVSPLQAGILTVGPILVALLAILVSYNYHRRQSIYWAPPAMLAVAAAVTYGTADLVTATQAGLVITMAVAALLTLHQASIRIQIALQRRQKLPRVHRALAIATGMGHYRWSET